MNRFLLGALAMGAVFVLTSFALTRTPPPKNGPAWTVSQYQLDRAFRVEATILTTPTTMVMPATGGIVITQLRVAGGGGTVNVAVNGAVETFWFPTNEPVNHYDLNPPIIVRPGETISFVATNTNPVLSIAGYTTLPGET